MELFNQFMHIYFWVYLCVLIDHFVRDSDSPTSNTVVGIIGFSLFIMSFSY